MAISIGAAILGAAGIGTIGNILGSSKQTKAITAATGTQERTQQMILDFQNKVYEESAGFRRIAEEEAEFDFAQKQAALPEIYKNLAIDPTDSPAFRRTLEKGTESIRSLYEPFGLGVESGPTSVATGEFAGQLYGDVYNQTVNRNLNTLLSLYGRGSGAGQQGAQATSTAAGLFGPISAAGGNISELQTAKGAVKGSLYGSIGQDVSNAALLAKLYG